MVKWQTMVAGSQFSEKMRLKGLAEEDVWFARRDRELIDALHRRRLAEQAGCDSTAKQIKARTFEKQFESINRQHHRCPHRLAAACRRLLERIRAACRFLD